jgi:Rrf2 family protein
MLQLTKRTEYGLIALVHMVDREGEFVSVREICEHYPLPRRLVAEVLKDLCREQIIESQRGAQGGYTLAASPDEINLAQVVSALEGEPALTSCRTLAPAKNGSCDVEPTCPIRSPIHVIRERLWRLMEVTTLRSLSNASVRSFVPKSKRESLLTSQPSH